MSKGIANDRWNTICDIFMLQSTERAKGEGGRERASDGWRTAKCTVTTKFGVVLPTPKVT